MSDEKRVQGLIDLPSLETWMDARELPGAGEPLTTRFISGGASNEIFELCRGDQRMALRRPPRKVPKGRNETMLRVQLGYATSPVALTAARRAQWFGCSPTPPLSHSPTPSFPIFASYVQSDFH